MSERIAAPRPSPLVALAALLVGAGLAAPARAQAQYPWPALVVGATNPLMGTPYPANGRNATANARVRLGLARGNRDVKILTHTAGVRPVVHGRLSDARDRPIVGAVVIIGRELYDRPGWRAVRRVRTSSKGRFKARMSPGWAGRRFAAIYWPFALSPTPAFSRRVLARVAPRVWLRATRRGNGLVSLRGRVTGSRIPPGGLVVNLQVRNRDDWVGVRLVRTNRAGRFSGRYRFSARWRRYTMRAQVPRQSGWRLHTGASKPVRVLVR